MVNVILHHSAFQRLEASWRGLKSLTLMAAQNYDSNIKVKLFNISLDILQKHLLTEVKLEETTLFEKIYHQEYNHPGGEPYSLWVGDYFIDLNARLHIKLLKKLADMAALAFVPLVMAIQNHDWNTTCLNNTAWNDLRKKPSACFLGLFYPEVLMRSPYKLESIDGAEDYLWGNPCYDYTIQAISIFSETGWFANIFKRSLNVQQPFSRYDRFWVDSCEQLNRKRVLKFYFTDKEIKALNKMGLTVFSESNLEKCIFFISNPSIQQTNQKNYSNSLPILLCVVRFVHCLKIMFRNKVGCLMEAERYESYLQHWLLSYCAQYFPSSSRLKAKYPLAYAKITLKKEKNDFTNYFFTIEIKPHSCQSNDSKVFLKSFFTVRQ